MKLFCRETLWMLVLPDQIFLYRAGENRPIEGLANFIKCLLNGWVEVKVNPRIGI
ncbi:hypothetical protein [Endozoicomonas montiporae]|uniref:hypothetical protein n=1 Tax=Endozoicomonas montiporae TaxID=1027273 RepID=UPI001F30811C|nr:hypothetical protein [Endozoicomonas montiporae]